MTSSRSSNEDAIRRCNRVTREATDATEPDVASLTKQIHVPVLLVDGGKDNHCCTPDVDGSPGVALGCTSTTEFHDHESADFTDCFSAMLVDSGHDINLHKTAPASYSDILRWETATLPAQSGAVHCAMTGPIATAGIPLT